MAKSEGNRCYRQLTNLIYHPFWQGSKELIDTVRPQCWLDSL